MASSGKSFDKSCTNPAAPCSGRGLPPSFDFLVAERDRLVEKVGDCKLLFPAPFTPVQRAHLAQYLDILRTVAPDLERYAAVPRPKEASFEPIEFDESIFSKPVMPEIPLKLFLTEEERVARLDSYRPELDNWRAASLKRVDAQLAHAYREHERREEHHATEATKLLEWSLRVFKALKRVPEFANLLNTSDEQAATADVAMAVPDSVDGIPRRLSSDQVASADGEGCFSNPPAASIEKGPIGPLIGYPEDLEIADSVNRSPIAVIKGKGCNRCLMEPFPCLALSVNGRAVDERCIFCRESGTECTPVGASVSWTDYALFIRKGGASATPTCPPFSLDFFGELGMSLVLRHSFRTSSENATMGAVLERSLNLECLTDNDQAALEKDMAAIANSPEGATLLALIGRRHRSLRQTGHYPAKSTLA
ncbi:hypothetical protein B0H14DRAFT_2702593 [Mycena olivaceomarginata]|nr:hypothetical protein B0H14DRAFT_2702593 [Mycena olivaceomarginata]